LVKVTDIVVTFVGDDLIVVGIVLLPAADVCIIAAADVYIIVETDDSIGCLFFPNIITTLIINMNRRAIEVIINIIMILF
jgi:hypothetical protein